MTLIHASEVSNAVYNKIQDFDKCNPTCKYYHYTWTQFPCSLCFYDIGTQKYTFYTKNTW